MLLAILVTIGACVKVSHSLVQSRQLPPDYGSIDTDIGIAAEDVAKLSSIAELPPVETSWGKLRAKADYHGFDIKSYGSGDTSQIQTYAGPLKSWSGIAQGDTQVVLRSFIQLQRQIPVFLYEYKLTGETVFISFSVVGT